MTTQSTSIADRVDALDWKTLGNELDSFGCTVLKLILTRDECHTIAGMFAQNDIFRSTVVMARHGFGKGEYKYWSYPLPSSLSDLEKDFGGRALIPAPAACTKSIVFS
jgi:hypothetical protein